MAGITTVGRATWAPTRPISITDLPVRLAAVASLLVLNLLDLVTTHRVIAGLGGVEGNPVSRWLLGHHVLGMSKALVVVAIGLTALRLPPRRATSIALWLVVGFYVAVVLHNTGQILAA